MTGLPTHQSVEVMEAALAELKSRCDALQRAFDALGPRQASGASAPNWFQRNASVGSALLAAAALTISSIYYYNAVITSKNNLANNLIYTMQKDERALVAEYASGKSGVGPANIIAQIQSVYIQDALGSVPDDVWPVFVSDFCDVMKREQFKREWTSLRDHQIGAFSNDFKTFMEDITQPNSKTCQTARK